VTDRVEGVQADVEAIRRRHEHVESLREPGAWGWQAVPLTLLAEAHADRAALLAEVERVEGEQWVRWLVYVGDPEQPIAGFVYASDAQRYGESNYRGRYRLVQRKSDDAPAPTDGAASLPVLRRYRPKTDRYAP
jgi:hypothetical protein